MAQDLPPPGMKGLPPIVQQQARLLSAQCKGVIVLGRVWPNVEIPGKGVAGR